MKRLHVSLQVTDLERSIAFYTTLFDAEPLVKKPDYAKWMLDDPRVNFAITDRGTDRGDNKGIGHLGIQAETPQEMLDVFGQVDALAEKTAASVWDQGESTCCYAVSRKKWVTDPDGIAWEAFLTSGESDSFMGAEEHAPDPALSKTACC